MVHRRRRRLAVLLAAAAASLAGAPAPDAAAQAPCAAWDARVVGSGLGRLENLEFDGRGALYLSVSDADAITRMTAAGETSTLASGIESPGGLRVRWPLLYANTDNSAQSASSGSTAGTIERIDLRSGERTTWVRGLTSPNGLVLLADGDALVSRALGSGSGITRVDADDPSRPQANWARVDGANGLALDADGRWLYAALTFTADSRIVRVDVTDPTRVEEVARLSEPGVPKGVDDLAIDSGGVLYLAANATGEVLRLDPGSGAVCAIASGLRQPSSVRIGCGAGWSAQSLYVTSFDGTLRQLTPAAGQPQVGSSPTCAPPGSESGPPPGGGPAPGAERCASRRVFRVRTARAPRGDRVVRARMTLDGQRLRTRRRRGRFVAVVDLRGRPPGVARLRIVARTRRGRTVRERRTYRTCAPSRAGAARG